MPDLMLVRAWFVRYWLACWFGIISAIRLSAVAGGEIGFDARLYLLATRTWLDGGDPWVSIGPQQFAAPPPSLIPLIPFALLPEPVGVAVLVCLAAVGVVATVYLLHLPWWWILFPPFLDGAWTGNVQTLLVPLILVGAGPVAAFLKVYALVPMALTLRWRALLVTVAALLVTAPLLPWASYIENAGQLMESLGRQSSGGLSATALPWLIPVAFAALVLCGRERTAWLAVPALWPSTQWYYSTLAVPGLVPVTGFTSIAAALLAVQIPGLVVGAVIVVALGERNWTPARLRSAWLPTRAP